VTAAEKIGHEIVTRRSAFDAKPLPPPLRGPGKRLARQSLSIHANKRGRNVRKVVAILLALCGSLAAISPEARAEDSWFTITGDDGSPVANHRVPNELTSEIERLSGIVVLGNREGEVTVFEFYDLNCPYCRKAAPEIADLLRADKDLKLVLVPFPVLSLASIQGSRVEIALAGLATPSQFYDFHRRVYARRGTVDGARALAVAKELGFDAKKLTQTANEDRVTDAMKAHVRLGNALGLEATPSFVVKGVAIVGYPGRKALETVVQSVHRCDNVVC
jgi:protein-disulfide isomerase